MIKFILLFFGLLVYGCTTPSYPSIDHPTQEITPEDSQIIAYIDQRLEEEYYWLDEVIKRSLSFDRRVPWANYMGRNLTMLSTNGDDGYINAKGERVLYPYIREVDAATRSTASTSTSRWCRWATTALDLSSATFIEARLPRPRTCVVAMS